MLGWVVGRGYEGNFFPPILPYSCQLYHVIMRMELGIGAGDVLQVKRGNCWDVAERGSEGNSLPSQVLV